LTFIFLRIPYNEFIGEGAEHNVQAHP
jgi:hypothetical protein